MDGLHDRFLNVSLLPGSRGHLAYYARVSSSLPGAARPAPAPAPAPARPAPAPAPARPAPARLAPARPAPARPALRLHFFGGKTIADLAKAMSDNDLQSVLQQYYEPAIRSGRPGPGSPSSSPRSSWPTARARSRSS